MKLSIVGGLAAVLLMGGLVATSPPAEAGCQYGGPGIISKCDGPIQPDGTWQRCVGFMSYVPNGASSHLVPDKRCDVLGPDQRPGDPAIADPPMHIDD